VKMIKIILGDLFKELDKIIELNSYYQRTNLYNKLKKNIKEEMKNE